MLLRDAAVGIGVATAVFLCGAAAQLIVGRLVERIAPYLLFVAVVVLQFIGILWAVGIDVPDTRAARQLAELDSEAR